MSDALDLIFGDDPDLIPTQAAPVQRPDPVRRPGPGRPAPQASAPGLSRKDAESLIFDDAEHGKAPLPQAQRAAGPYPGFKPIADETMAEYVWNNIRGRKDPRYAGLKAIDEEMAAEGNDKFGRKVVGSSPFAVTDQQQLDIAKQGLGDRFIRTERDAHGANVIVYRGQDGSEKKAYENVPGLDALDTSRFVMQAIPYALMGGAAGMGAKALGTAVARQGVAGAATSLGSDVAAQGFGATESPDLVRAGVAGSFGAGTQLAAPAVGALWRRFVTEPGLIQGGQLTPKGIAAAKEAGLDPAILTPEVMQQFAEEVARTGSTRIGKTVLGRQFDIPISRGQMSKDPSQLLTEKAMRNGVYDDAAKTTMQDFDRRQAMAVERAAFGGPDAKRSVAQQIAPDRAGQGIGPAEIGSEIMAGTQEAKKGAQEIYRTTWDQVKQLGATDAAKAELSPVLTAKVGPLRLDEKVTPKAAAMLEDLDAFVAGGAPGAKSKILQQSAVQDVGDMRKRLLALYKGASESQDIAASKALYDGFNEWIEKSAEKALLTGDPASAVWMRKARDVSKEMMSIFGPTATGGRETPGRKIIQSLLNEGTTPETIVGKLFSTDPGSMPRAGTVEALNLIKHGMDKYLPPIRAQAVWQDIKIGQWQKLIMKPDGSLHTPTVMAQNIDKFFRSQASVAKALYTGEDSKVIRQFGAAMREIAYKDPNPSGSGVAAAFYASQWGQAITRMVMNPQGPVSRVLNILMAVTPVKRVAGDMAAQRAINPRMPTRNPTIGSVGSFVGQRSENDPATGPARYLLNP